MPLARASGIRFSAPKRLFFGSWQQIDVIWQAEKCVVDVGEDELAVAHLPANDANRHDLLS